MTTKQIEQILVPGIYKGEGIYEPTKKYPNGIFTRNILKIEKDEGFYLKITNEIIAYDSKTNRKLYKGTRKAIVYQDSNEKSKYIYESKSYIDKKIVSSQFGNISSINTKLKTMTIKLLQSYWYITNVLYSKSIIKFTREPKTKKLTSVFKHDEKKKGENSKIKFEEEYFQQ